ncbi:heat shock 70kDa protein 8 [Trichonephila clavipes]|nr:heat shock 70kDa protein 8 [Trichonephila clavipes]
MDRSHKDPFLKSREGVPRFPTATVEIGDIVCAVLVLSCNTIGKLFYSTICATQLDADGTVKIDSSSLRRYFVLNTAVQHAFTGARPRLINVDNTPRNASLSMRYLCWWMPTSAHWCHFCTQELWVQQDGATCHTARATIDLLKDTFGDRLISRFGPVNWPPRSCDLTPLDSFLWGYVKSLVYADKPQTLDHLEDNIRRVIADIRPHKC